MRRRDDGLQDARTSDLDAGSYDQATADVDPAAPKPRQTFAIPPQSPAIASAAVEPTSPPPVESDAARAHEGSAASVGAAPVAAQIPQVEAPSPASPAETSSEPVAPMVRETTTGSLLSNRYLLGRVLGAGGGSLVFQAEDRRRIGAEDFGSRIAIKVLRPEMRHNSHALTRLKREFRQMQRLTHPGVARVFELACDEDIWFMTMELIDGQTINQWLKSSTSRTAAMQIIAGCCDALSHAHEAGIVHGDLKPSNVLVLANGGVKLVDFGSAAERDAATGEVDKERSFAATPPYASPQVLAGEIADPRDDVFSLACLAYAVLTHGEHPFDRKSSAEAQQAQLKPAYSRALLPRQFEVIVRALSWDREHRPATAREFWHALLASDLRREPGAQTVDVASKPLPSTPTRDAPTVATSKAEVTTESSARPAAVRAEPTGAPDSKEPTPKRDAGVKQEDIARLKSAVAAAEALAERIDAPEPRDESERAVDPMARFRGYVAGPMAQRGEGSASIGIVPAAVETQATRAPEAPSKTTKRVWPWQRSAWVLAIAVAGALTVATQFDVDSEPIADAQAKTLPQPPAIAPPAAVALASTPDNAPQVEEKKSPHVAIKNLAPPAAPGEISFTTRTLQVGAGQTIAALSVKRLNSTRGRARVAWTIEGGTARAGVDYQLGTAQLIEFLEGQSVRSLFIPLLPEKGVGDARTSKTFTVKLQPTSGSPRLGEIRQVHVTIVGDVADERVARTE